MVFIKPPTIPDPTAANVPLTGGSNRAPKMANANATNKPVPMMICSIAVLKYCTNNAPGIAPKITTELICAHFRQSIRDQTLSVINAALTAANRFTTTMPLTGPSTMLSTAEATSPSPIPEVRCKNDPRKTVIKTISPNAIADITKSSPVHISV